MPIDRGQPTGEWETSFNKATFSRPPLLEEQAVLSLKRSAWSFRVLPGDAIISGQHQTTNILNRQHAGWNCSLQWHLSPAISPLSHRYRAWKCWWHRGRELVLWACAIKFLGGVQCAQYWPQPLHPWFIWSSKLGHWEWGPWVVGFMSDCPCPRWIACQGCRAPSAFGI